MDITRIDDLIASSEFFEHPVLKEAMAAGRKRRGRE
jgi:hypothetical protein